MGDFYLMAAGGAVAAAGVGYRADQTRHLGDDIAMYRIMPQRDIADADPQGHRVAVCEQLVEILRRQKRGYKSIVNQGRHAGCDTWNAHRGFVA
jgi:hypothetical protein